MDIDQVLGGRRADVLRIAAAHGARNVRVFGSLARGDGGPGSDLDILISLEPRRSLLDIVAIKQDLEDLLGRKVDVVTEAAINPYIRDQIMKDAVGL